MKTVIKSKNLSFQEAVSAWKTDKRRFRRKDDEYWHEMHEGKLTRGEGGNGIRGLTVDDALAQDWELEQIYRQCSAEEIIEAMLISVRQTANHRLGPMEHLNNALIELGLL